jgi:hypothetical protein
MPNACGGGNVFRACSGMSVEGGETRWDGIRILTLGD